MNKSFHLSPTASSETSETQSINDEPITINRSVKQTKKSKESEKERPPWKPVSIATPSRADKSALLKAKILDATRRALISQRIANTSTQTDPIPTKDEQVETDGSVTIKKESPGGFILTQTIGLTTDGVLVNDVGTQTAIPKISLSFPRFPNRISSKSQRIYQSVNDSTTNILQKQIDDIKKLDEQLWKIRSKTLNKSDDNTTKNEIQSDDPRESRFSDDSLCDSESPTSNQYNKLSNVGGNAIRNEVQGNFLDVPTLTSWAGFESTEEDDEYDLPELPKRTMSRGYSPWNNFKDVVIGNRLANMHLSPIPLRKRSLKCKSVTWSDSQHRAVSELISEASALLDVFDNVAMFLGPDLKLKHSPKKSLVFSKLPESKWQPVLAKSTKELEERLQNFQPHVFPKNLSVDDENHIFES